MPPPTNSAGPAPSGPDRLHNVPVQASVGTGESPRGRRLVGVLAVPSACVVALVVTAWLDVASPDHGTGATLAPDLAWPNVLNGLVLAGLAAVILLRSPRQPFGWMVALLGVFWAVDGLCQGYVAAGLTATSAWPGMTFAFWFYSRFGAFLPVSIAVILMIFPDGRLLPGRWGVVGRCTIAVYLLVGLTILVAPVPDDQADVVVPPGVDLDPTTLDLLRRVPPEAQGVPVSIGICAFLVTLLLVVVRYRGSTGVARDRMRWLLWSAVMIVIALLASLAVHLPGMDYVVGFVVMVLPAVGMTIAIVRPAVVPIQDLLGRTLVLAAVLAVLVAADVVVLAGLTAVLDDDLSQVQVATVVLVVAVFLYGPLRQGLSRLVQRRMLGERGNRYDALADLSSTLENTDAPDEQLAAVARAVAAAFAVRFVSLEVEWTTGDRMVTTHGERPAQVRTLPITYRSAPVGRLVLPARGLRSRLTPRDERLLGDLVRQAVTAVRTSQLAEEVQQSRERLVAAREEERRRIRRDLHDGFGPALSGIVFQLDAARMTVGQDPTAATAQLERVSSQVQDVVADVRRLVHDLRPPALDDRGLVGALRQQAELLALPVGIDVDEGLAALPAAVEVAAYRIAGEALTNVVRHARASRATLRLAVEGDALLLEVADDGVGIPADRQAGVGLASLRERAAELGGSTTVTCPPGGGTVVRARLPLRSPV